MDKLLKTAPVYTKDLVITTKDDKKKQAIIDQWTDELAQNMARKSNVSVDDDGDINVEHYSKRGGGHNALQTELLNMDGYLVRIFHSIVETAEYLGIHPNEVSRSLKKIRKSLLVPGYAVRLRDISKNKPQKQLSYERKTNKNNRTDIAQRL
jgi:hypothetical protein